jgi:hypothetical protein
MPLLSLPGQVKIFSLQQIQEGAPLLGSTAVHPVSCGNRQQWVVCGHSHQISARAKHSFGRPAHGVRNSDFRIPATRERPRGHPIGNGSRSGKTLIYEASVLPRFSLPTRDVHPVRELD